MRGGAARAAMTFAAVLAAAASVSGKPALGLHGPATPGFDWGCPLPGDPLTLRVRRAGPRSFARPTHAAMRPWPCGGCDRQVAFPQGGVRHPDRREHRACFTFRRSGTPPQRNRRAETRAAVCGEEGWIEISTRCPCVRPWDADEIMRKLHRLSTCWPASVTGVGKLVPRVAHRKARQRTKKPDNARRMW